jgi:hypothetical protein
MCPNIPDVCSFLCIVAKYVKYDRAQSHIPICMIASPTLKGQSYQISLNMFGSRKLKSVLPIGLLMVFTVFTFYFLRYLLIF